MLTVAVHERRDQTVVQIIETATDKRKTCGRQIRDSRRKIELAAEPRFNRMLVGRRDVGDMAGQYRTRVAAIACSGIASSCDGR